MRIDLTGPLHPGMWSYQPLVPDIPPFEQRRWAMIDERGWEADWFAMPTLAGTYLETAKHLYADAPSIDEVPLDRCVVSATVAHIPKGPREHITIEDLEQTATDLQHGDAFLVATGWERFRDDSATFVLHSPHFDLAAMQWLVDRGIGILGGDMPCFDDPVGEEAQQVNHVLFGSGALILAPLVRMSTIEARRGTLTVLPIPLVGACGAPCRAMFEPIDR